MHLTTLLPFAAAAHAALTYKGVDWSSLLVEESSGITYTGLDGQTAPLETILSANGVNAVRQRLWVNPSDGNYNLDYNLELGKRAAAAGLQVYLDFHYSDSWADPGQQTTPSAWQNYGIDDLAWQVYNYTLDSVNAFADAGVSVSLVSIGNEITAGMLWPLGRMSESGGTYNLARLLHSASAGVKDSNLDQTPQIVIHLDDGWDEGTQTWWYDEVLSQGPLVSADFDVQGVSYYPFYNSDATLGALKSSLATLKSKYGKQVMVVETNWPTSCPDPDFAFPSDTTDIPFSAAGQSTWLQDVAGAGGSGLFYWEPAWVDNSALGSSCPYNTMFEYPGKALSSLATFKSL